MIRLSRRTGLCAAMVLMLALPGPASAHSSATGDGPVAGVPIAEITHGQMPIIARHVAPILDLATRQPRPDLDLRRVLNYAKLQRAFCLWGWVPGSIGDEASPFNACSHAHLAAARDLLLRMKAGGNAEAQALAARIDAEMLMFSTALELCSYSASPYDTAAIVPPVWRDVPGHPASAVSLGAVLLALLALGAMLVRWLMLPTAREAVSASGPAGQGAG